MRLFAMIILFLGFTACTTTGKKEQATKVDKSDKATQTTTAKAKAPEKSNSERYTCTVGKDKRLVEINRTTGRCEVHYTKSGEDNSVAWAEATPSICTEVFGRIRNNIESAGFKCDPKLAQKEARNER